MPLELPVSDATIWSIIVYLFRAALFNLIFVIVLQVAACIPCTYAAMKQNCLTKS